MLSSTIHMEPILRHLGRALHASLHAEHDAGDMFPAALELLTPCSKTNSAGLAGCSTYQLGGGEMALLLQNPRKQLRGQAGSSGSSS